MRGMACTQRLTAPRSPCCTNWVVHTHFLPHIQEMWPSEIHALLIKYQSSAAAAGYSFPKIYRGMASSVPAWPLWTVRETQYVATPRTKHKATPPSILFVGNHVVACRYLYAGWQLWHVDLPSGLQIVDGFEAYDLLAQLEPKLRLIIIREGAKWKRRSVERDDNIVFESLRRKMPGCNGIHWKESRNFHSETILFLPIQGLKMSRTSSKHCLQGDMNDGLPTGTPSFRTRSRQKASLSTSRHPSP